MARPESQPEKPARQPSRQPSRPERHLLRPSPKRTRTGKMARPSSPARPDNWQDLKDNQKAGKTTVKT